jgi:arylsulfatase A-like enzyme
LDRLAGEQIRFNQAHAASPVCTPTRASILTGRHPARLNMTIWRENALNQKPRVVETPVTTCDLFPTILRSLEVAWPEDLVLDGVDVRSLWPNVHANLDRHALYFHYPHYYPTTTPVSSIRQGPWKLLEYYEDQTLELYHLTDDPGEIRNLVDSQPSVAERLRTQLKLWRESVSASMPEKNPHQP